MTDNLNEMMSNDIHEIIIENIYNYNVLNTIQNVLNNLSENEQHTGTIFFDENCPDNNNDDNEYYELDIQIYHNSHSPQYDNYFKSCNEINSILGKSYKIKDNDKLIGENCMICMEQYKIREFKRIIPNCQHIFHKKCIDKWLQMNASCPVCRYDLLGKDQTTLDLSESIISFELSNNNSSLSTGDPPSGSPSGSPSDANT